MREFLLVLLVAGCGVAAWRFSRDVVEPTYEEYLRDNLNAGMDCYERGHYLKSYEHFEKAFLLKPSSDLIYAFIKRRGDDLVASMMNAPDEHIKGIGHRLFNLAKPGTCRLTEPYRIILNYIADLDSDNWAIYRNAFWHLKIYGIHVLFDLEWILHDDISARHKRRIVSLIHEIRMVIDFPGDSGVRPARKAD